MRQSLYEEKLLILFFRTFFLLLWQLVTGTWPRLWCPCYSDYSWPDTRFSALSYTEKCAEVAVASLRTAHDEWVIEVLPESDWTLCQKYDDFLAKGRVTTWIIGRLMLITHPMPVITRYPPDLHAAVWAASAASKFSFVIWSVIPLPIAYINMATSDHLIR